MFGKNIFVLVLSLFSFYKIGQAQNGKRTVMNSQIVYPAAQANRFQTRTNNRPVVDNPRLCKEHELLYPGDNEGDWVCDCKPGFVYYPATDSCYEAYTQGPCKEDEILQIASKSSIPKCLQNRCPTGKVFFKENCFVLNEQEGCKEYRKYIGRKVFLVPRPMTLELICADESFNYECVDECCNGSNSEHRDICKGSRDEKHPTLNVLENEPSTNIKNVYKTTAATIGTPKPYSSISYQTTRKPWTAVTGRNPVDASTKHSQVYSSSNYPTTRKPLTTASTKKPVGSAIKYSQVYSSSNYPTTRKPWTAASTKKPVAATTKYSQVYSSTNYSTTRRPWISPSTKRSLATTTKNLRYYNSYKTEYPIDQSSSPYYPLIRDPRSIV